MIAVPVSAAVMGIAAMGAMVIAVVPTEMQTVPIAVMMTGRQQQGEENSYWREAFPDPARSHSQPPGMLWRR
jgi:hypothetical protein